MSLKVQETLPLLLRMVEPEELAQYDSMTPTTLDYLADYDDAIYPMMFQHLQHEGVATRRILLYTRPQIILPNRAWYTVKVTARAPGATFPTHTTS